MTAYVTIPVASANDVVKIPNGALRYTPDMDEAQRTALLKKYNLLGPPPQETAKKENGDGTAQAQERPANAGQGGEGRRGQWGNMSEEDRAKMRERMRNMSPEERAKMRQMFMAQRQGQEQPGGFQAPPRTGPGAEGAWQIVWKLNPDNTLQPVRVKTGITDLAYTAMLAGELKAGDQLVIAQAGGKTQPTNQPLGRTGPMRF